MHVFSGLSFWLIDTKKIFKLDSKLCIGIQKDDNLVRIFGLLLRIYIL